jgi:AraC-like DNA-binding protein
VPRPLPPVHATGTGASGRDLREVAGAWSSFQRFGRLEPAPDLAAFVAGYWFAQWDLRGQPPYRQLTVPYPQVHLSFGYEPVPVVRGATQTHVVRVLSEAGRVFGVAFRPGCFRPFLGRPVSTITGRSLPACQVFGQNVPGTAMVDAHDELEMVTVVERFLREHRPEVDPAADLATVAVQRVIEDPGLTRVDTLAERVHLSVRQLQRLFSDHVGISPKRVIRRYRLHEVSRRLDQGAAVNWGGLAAELGYSDQAHLTRDFAAVFGEPPTWYARRYPT